MAEDVFGIVGTTQGGAFRVDEVVGEGGFAVVYRAYHGAFRSNVALKCLKVPRTLSEADQKAFLERFREEAELLFRLSSATPSVVRPLHVGTLATKERQFVPFIALEWLEGNTLDTVISTRALDGQPPLALRAAVKLLTPVADALCRAHHFPTASGGVVSIVHRDLKPENIFISKSQGRDVAKVLDFGIAKVKSVTTEMVGRQSAADSLSVFTPAYGAPEQWLPKRYGQTGPWTDVWGLAITLVETVCGHAPMDGDQVAMMGAAIDPERRPTPRNEGVAISDEAEAVFVQALAVDPRDRFHDVGAFWNALSGTVGLPPLALPNADGAVPTSLPPPPMAADPAARTVLTPHRPAETAAVPDLVLDSKASVRAPGSGPRSGRDAARDLKVPIGGGPRLAFDDEMPARNIEMDRGRGMELHDGRGGLAPARARPPTAPVYVGRFPEPRARKLELGGPLRLIALSVGLMGGDWGYAALTGEVLHYGPVRVLWVAGPVLVIGVLRLAQRLLAAGD